MNSRFKYVVYEFRQIWTVKMVESGLTCPPCELITKAAPDVSGL